jgi:hypothetical protein
VSNSGVSREPALAGQTIVVIGGSSGSGLDYVSIRSTH